MRILHSIFSNFWVIIPLGFVYAAACGVATFIENDYGTMLANAVIYRSWWFNLLHLYLALALIFSFVFSSAWRRKKYAIILLHLSFVFMIVGAGITRFFSYEGIMHIREGDRSFGITASEPTLNIMAMDSSGKREFYFLHKTLLSAMGRKDERIQFFNQSLQLSDFSARKTNQDKIDNTLEVGFKACYNSVCNHYQIIGDSSGVLNFQQKDFGNTKIFISYGSREIPLPFGLKLQKFELERYAGSMSPSSYASEVEVLDLNGNLIKPYRIFMNHVLDYKGYRFYQSSYDQDEKGTILSVNKDPGKNITYLGYAMLILGAILTLFSKKGRFRTLARFLQDQRIAGFALVILLGFFTQNLRAEENLQPQETELTSQQKADFLHTFATNSKRHTQEFAKIQLQNFSGRIEPVDTIANGVIRKITHKKSLFDMDGNQLFLGMMLYPQVFKDLKMIYIGRDEGVRELLGLKKGDTYASFSDFYSPSIGYKLHNYVQDANRKDPAKRDMLDKNVLKVDERVNLVYAIFSGAFLKLFPVEIDGNTRTWLDPLSVAKFGDANTDHEVSRLLGNVFRAFDSGVFKNDWGETKPSLEAISKYQKAHSPELYLSASKVHAEMFLNSSNIFGKLFLPYILLGLLFLINVVISMIKNVAPSKKLSIVLYVLAYACLLAHSVALILRWYVSGHSPWSNAYESMLYISWASGVAGMIFFRRYTLAVAAALFLAGISLFVADLGFMDPQITPLVPVLKSYWLNIHVSIITASYGFLGLCFILGVMSLVLFMLRSKTRPNIDNSILSLYALNEMAMILGLIFLTIGNFLGGVWANESWGRYWSWDAKETWALISIVIYSIVLHLRFMGFKSMPYVFSVASVLAFYVILMTYFGVNYYLSGMHSYAAGDPVPVPTFVYYFVGVTVALVLFSLHKRKLETSYV